jgi:tetratricopeptide (TPR) repeat protein
VIDARGRAAATLLARGAPALAFLLALLVDLNSLPGAFLADDFEVVVRNPLVARLDLRAIFTTDYWGPGWDSGLHRPLTTLSFAVNRLIFGPGPLSFHAVNVLLHAGAAGLFALALSALGFRSTLVFAAASLFAVHPIHADVVNIVVGRAELLAALFLFAGLRLALAKGRRAWPLVLACQLAALLSKEHAVVFLPLLIVADAFAAADPPAAGRSRRPLYALLLAVTLCWLGWRWWVFRAAGGSPLLIYAADNPLVDAAWPVRLLTAAKVNLVYLASLALPLRLQSSYSGPGLRVVDGVFSGWGLASLAYAALCAAALVHGWRGRRAHGFGIPLYLLGFAVTANILVLTSVLMADRLAYLPSAGFSLVAAALLLAPLQRASGPRPARLGLLLPAGYALFLATLTLGRNAAFQDPEGFWRSVVAAEPRNVRAGLFLAQAAEKNGHIAETERALRGAVGADPSFPDASIALSLFLLERGRPAEAAEYALQGMARAPQGVGLAQFALARAYLALGRPAEALTLLEEVSPMFSSTFEFQAGRGAALEALDRPSEATAAYREALALRSEAGTLRRQAGLLLKLGRYRETEQALLEIPPRQRTAADHNLLGVTLALQGRREEARREFTAAVALDPGSEKYRANLERAQRGPVPRLEGSSSGKPP